MLNYKELLLLTSSDSHNGLWTPSVSVVALPVLSVSCLIFAFRREEVRFFLKLWGLNTAFLGPMDTGWLRQNSIWRLFYSKGRIWYYTSQTTASWCVRTHFKRVIHQQVNTNVFCHHGRTQRVILSFHLATGQRTGHSRCTAVALPLGWRCVLQNKLLYREIACASKYSGRVRLYKFTYKSKRADQGKDLTWGAEVIFLWFGQRWSG